MAHFIVRYGADMLPPKITLEAAFSQFSDTWSPKLLASVADCHVKVAKFQGEFVWHSHAEEDELFYVVAGELTLHFENGAVTLNPGELLVVPKGVRHKPEAPAETWVMLIEPTSTVNTGEVRNQWTVEEVEVLEP
jgi:mannose-6-phosphate isomerase-like protein (cupin superfamily)